MSYIKLFLYPLIALLLGLGVFAFKNIKKTLKKYKNIKQINYPSQWSGLVRKDWNQWPNTKILIGCFVKFPIKAIILISVILSYWATITLRQKYHLINLKIQKLLFKLFRVMLKIAFEIQQQNIPQDIQTPIIISNHVNWIDIVYLVSRCYPVSFVVKQQISKAPIIGPICFFTNCLFITRQNQKARQQVLNKIQARVQQYNQGKQTHSLIIYPQGTTSNGRYILKFKKGAFSCKPNITIFGLIYSCEGFECGMDEITPLQHFLISLSLSIKLKVKAAVMKAKQQQTCQQYMSRCREQLSVLTGFELSQCGFTQKCELGKMRKQR